MTESPTNKTRYMGFKLDMSALENLMKTDGIKPASIKTIRDNYKSIICYVFDKTVPSLQDHGSPENLAKIVEYVKSDQVPWKRKPVMINSYRKVLGYMKIPIPEGGLGLPMERSDYESMTGFDIDLSDIRAKMEQKKMKMNTITTYLTHFKRLVHDALDKVRPADKALNYKATVTKVLEYINGDNVKVSRRPIFLYSYITIMKLLGVRVPKNSAIMTAYSKTKNASDEFNEHRELTEAEKEKESDRYVSMADLVKLREEAKAKLTDKFTREDINYLLLCLYTYISPQRSEVFYKCRYFEDSSNEKTDDLIYFDKTLKKIVLNVHKSVGTLGKREIELDDVICQTIDAFHNKTNSPWLVCTVKLLPFSQSQMSHTLKKITGGIGSSGIRNVYKDELNGNPLISTGVRKAIAFDMGHRYRQSEMTYTKLGRNGITCRTRKPIKSVEQVEPVNIVEQIQPVQVAQVQAVQLAPPAEPIQPVQAVEQVPETQTIQPVQPVDEVRRENDTLRGRVKTLEEDLRELKDMMKQFLDLKIVLSKISEKVHNSV